MKLKDDTLRRKKRWSILAALSALAVAVSPMLTAPTPAEAALNPGNIISDSQFYNGNAMSAEQVQSFLDQRVSNCLIGTAKYPAGGMYDGRRLSNACLKDFEMETQSQNLNRYCSAYQGSGPGNKESAASIIAKVGAACGISQKVLLVMLQKEQSLITNTAPYQRRYDIAMGYGCPDTGENYSANCSDAPLGFFQSGLRGGMAVEDIPCPPE